MATFFYALISVLIVSSCSLLGFFLLSPGRALSNLLFFLVSFAAGSLLGDAFIHLLPEAGRELGLGSSFFTPILAGIIFFFVLEKFICWRHCHVPTSENHPHPLVFMNLIGDAFHNFIDGGLIAAAFISGTSLGVATALAVIFHEIPQEIGEFGVLLHAGVDRKTAVSLNFLSALWAVVGAVLFFIFSSFFSSLSRLAVPFTAGGFIYIAGSDLIPELHKETNLKKSGLQLIGMILGLVIMRLLLILEL